MLGILIKVENKVGGKSDKQLETWKGGNYNLYNSRGTIHAALYVTGVGQCQPM